MKRTGLLLVTLSISVAASSESAYEKAVHAIENQNFEQLDEAFSSQESISPQELKLLLKKAEAICEIRTKNLSVFSSKKDLAMFTIGTIIGCLAAREIIFDELPKLLYPEAKYDFGDDLDNPENTTNRKLRPSELADIKKLLYGNLLLSTCGAGLAFKGYTCIFARRALNKSKQILATVKAYKSS